MTMYLLWREYRTENPDGYGYTQFCYHVNQYTEAHKPSFVLSPDREGGQYLFADFAGDTMSYVDIETGEDVKCQVFVATLPASDYGFAMAVPSQKVDDFLYATERCLDIPADSRPPELDLQRYQYFFLMLSPFL